MKRVKELRTIVTASVTAVALMLFVSCSSDDDGPSDLPVDDTVLTGSITSDRTLDASIEYTLRGSVIVQDGATLTIPAGTRIVSDATDGVDVLIVNQGGRLLANGTAADPIVFTSVSMQIGSWGGLVLLGKAPINVPGGTSSPEFDNNLTYGGDASDDSSGSLTYVRVEYAGAPVVGGSVEYNGFGFYAVGSGTTLHHLETYKGSDDGFEWFGGTVTADNLISIGDEDDSFDATEGWTGGGSNWIGIKDGNADNGFEWDNNEFDNNATPATNPTVSNVTLIGTGASNGMLLRRGTAGVIENVIIRNFNQGIYVQNSATVQNAIDGFLVIADVFFDSIVELNYANDQEEDISSAINENPAATGADDAFAAGWSRYDAESWGGK